MSQGRPKLLVVDDGDRYIELLHALLPDYEYATLCELPGPCWECDRRPGCELTHAHDAAEADQALVKHRDVDVVLLDVAFDIPLERLLPSAETDPSRRRRLQGIEILAHLRRARGDLPVVLMTSEEELAFADAAQALKVDEFVTLAGADAFDARALGLLVERTLERRRASPEGGGYAFGRTPAMAQVRREAAVLARTSLPVLILGETGTGKSALAEKVIHPATGREGAFVSVDLAALPDTLLASELFGTTRGAFSGAVERAGRFEEAHGGTLFLDEIGNLPLDVQRMLLLALQDGRITRLGQSSPRQIDVKLIAATNADLLAKVRDGSFRADLYARLNPAARIHLPPLRERLEDLPLLLRAFVRRTFAAGADRALLADYMEAAGLSGAPRARLAIGADAGGAAGGEEEEGVAFVLSTGSLADLAQHSFPGNVRELQMLIANASVFALADAFGAAQRGRALAASLGRTIPIPAKLVRELLRAGWADAPAPPTPGPGAGLRLRYAPASSLREVARELEKQLYAHLFHASGGDFEAMAGRLLTGEDPTAARRVRLRFNQLGLKVRELRRAGAAEEGDAEGETEGEHGPDEEDEEG